MRSHIGQCAALRLLILEVSGCETSKMRSRTDLQSGAIGQGGGVQPYGSSFNQGCSPTLLILEVSGCETSKMRSGQGPAMRSHRPEEVCSPTAPLFPALQLLILEVSGCEKSKIRSRTARDLQSGAIGQGGVCSRTAPHLIRSAALRLSFWRFRAAKPPK